MASNIQVANAACGEASKPLLAGRRAEHSLLERQGCGYDLEVALGEAQHDDASETLSLAEASFTTTNLLVNFAALSAPYIIAQNGLAGIGVMSCAVGVCIFTGHLLADALEAVVFRGILRPTAGALAEEALGRIFGRFMKLMCPFECFIYCLGNTVCVVQTLLVPFPDSDVRVLAALSGMLMMLQSGVPDKYYAYLSLLSLLGTLSLFTIIMTFCAELPEWAADVGILANSGAQLPTGFSLSVFSIAGHCCLPMIFNSTACKQHAVTAWKNAMLFWLSVASVFGISVYFVFGKNAQPLATANFGRDINMNRYDISPVLVLAQQVSVLAACQLKLVTPSRPVAEIFLDILGCSWRPGQGGVQGILSAIPVCMFVVPASVAFLDKMDVLEAFCGSIVMGLNAFIFPGLVYLWICHPRGVMRLLALGVVGLGFALAISMNAQFVLRLYSEYA